MARGFRNWSLRKLRAKKERSVCFFFCTEQVLLLSSCCASRFSVNFEKWGSAASILKIDTSKTTKRNHDWLKLCDQFVVVCFSPCRRPCSDVCGTWRWTRLCTACTWKPWRPAPRPALCSPAWSPCQPQSENGKTMSKFSKRIFRSFSVNSSSHRKKKTWQGHFMRVRAALVLAVGFRVQNDDKDGLGTPRFRFQPRAQIDVFNWNWRSPHHMKSEPLDHGVLPELWENFPGTYVDVDRHGAL